jgi:integrase
VTALLVIRSSAWLDAGRVVVALISDRVLWRIPPSSQTDSTLQPPSVGRLHLISDQATAVTSPLASQIRHALGNVDALRATRPASLRHAPTVQETADLLRNVRDVAGYPTRLIVRLLYGCGLRVSEPLNLRVKDLNFDDSQVFILGAKGGKDRVVALPCSVVDDLREQMVYARTIWQRDRTMKIPVEMPHQLAAKYPEYQFSWPWAWVFPSHQPCRHPRTGAIVRYRMHEANVQRAVKEARRKLGIAVTPHELRHAYATHNLNRGVNIKALSQAMGHAQIETTSGYCHAEALSVPSPLEMMA